MRAFASSASSHSALLPPRTVSMAQPLPAKDSALSTLLATRRASGTSAASLFSASALSPEECSALRSFLATPTGACALLPLAALCELPSGSTDPSFFSTLHSSAPTPAALASVCLPRSALAREDAAALRPLPHRLATALQVFAGGTLGRTGVGMGGEGAEPGVGHMVSPQACAEELSLLFQSAEKRAEEKGKALGRSVARARAAGAGAGAGAGTCPEEARSKWGSGMLEDVGTVGEAEMALCGRLAPGCVMLGRAVQILGKRLGLFASAGREELGAWVLSCGGEGGASSSSAASGGISLRTPCQWRPIVECIVGSMGAGGGAALAAAEADAAAAAAAASPFPNRLPHLRPAFLSLANKLSHAFAAADLEHEVKMGVPLSAHRALASAGGAGVSAYAPASAAVLPTELPWQSLVAALQNTLGISAEGPDAPVQRSSAWSSSSSAAPDDAGSSGSGGGSGGGGGDGDALTEDTAQASEHLHVISSFREGTRSAMVKSHLTAAFTTRVRLVAQRARAVFFEVTVRNPLDIGDYFDVHIKGGSGELRVITDAKEWEWFRAVCTPAVPDPGLSLGWGGGGGGWGGGAQSRTRAPFLPPAWQPLTHDATSASASGGSSSSGSSSGTASPSFSTPRIFLPPGQTLTLPLVYQCFACLPPPTGTAPSLPTPGLDILCPAPTPHTPPSHGTVERSAELLLISTSTSRVAAALHCAITLCAAPISRTIRYCAGEETWVRGVLPLPPHTHTSALYAVAGEAGGAALALHSAARHGGGGYPLFPPGEGVVTTLGPSLPSSSGPRRELSFRTRAGPSPAVTAFHICLYDDPHHAIPRSVWRVAVHSVLSAEGPSCTPGGEAGLELLLRGSSLGSATALRLFTDAARGTAVFPSPMGGPALPSALLTLPSGAPLHRLALCLRPRVPGPRRETVLVHAVDASAGGGGALVAAWRVSAHVAPAAVTRVYDVALVGSRPSALPASAAVLKRLEYANEWDAARCVSLACSHPALVALRSATVALPARGRGAIKMAVACAPVGTQEDVHLYVRDESGAVEETLLLRLAWT